MFDTSEAEGHPRTTAELAAEWLDELRGGLESGRHYLAYKDESRVSVLPLTREWTKIGRSLTADIRLDDPTVSRRHALICRQGDAVRALDDRSLNGIFLNGERTEWAQLHDRDELIIGRYHLYFIDTGSDNTRTPDAAGLSTA